MTHTVYLSLGSNLGDREGNLHAAVENLSAQVTVGSVSSIYETDPLGFLEQPPFLNLALAAQTDLPPADLLGLLKETERQIGRQPTFRWGPRIIDIDIILYDELVTQTDDLTIPHPEMANRPFVLVPLDEIGTEVLHPVLHLKVRELKDRVAGLDGVRLLRPYPSP